jgi:hypothetical protein
MDAVAMVCEAIADLVRPTSMRRCEYKEMRRSLFVDQEMTERDGV